MLLGVVVRSHRAVSVIAVPTGRSSVVAGYPVRRYGREIVSHKAVQIVFGLIQFCWIGITVDVRHTQCVGRCTEMQTLMLQARVH